MLAKIYKTTVNIILFLLILIGVMVVFSFLPMPGNFKVFTVQSGSMEPAIRTGSLIFVKPVRTYDVNDVITKRTEDPKFTVTHRIVAKDEIGGKAMFETKGDANDAADGVKFGQGDIIGKVFFKVPYLGFAVGYAKTTPGFVILVVVPAIIIIYDELQKIKSEVKKKLQYKREQSHSG